MITSEFNSFQHPVSGFISEYIFLKVKILSKKVKKNNLRGKCEKKGRKEKKIVRKTEDKTENEKKNKKEENRGKRKQNRRKRNKNGRKRKCKKKRNRKKYKRRKRVEKWIRGRRKIWIPVTRTFGLSNFDFKRKNLKAVLTSAHFLEKRGHCQLDSRKTVEPGSRDSSIRSSLMKNWQSKFITWF